MCEHDYSCRYCVDWHTPTDTKPCVDCSVLTDMGSENFKCAICKTEKSPLTDDNSKT